MGFREVLSYCSTWIVIVPLIVGVTLYGCLKGNSKLILLLIVFASIPQIMFALVWEQNSEINLVYNIYTLIEFILLMLFFYRLRIFDRAKFFSIFSVFVFISAVAYLVLIYGFRTFFLSRLVFLSNFIYTGWILFYLYTIIKEDAVFSFKSSQTWYLTAYLLYSPCTALVFLFWNQRNNGIPILKDIGFVQSFFNIILYVFIATGFIVDYTKNKKCQEMT
ncbi:MAG: hypothetical protein QM594_05945 [Niabella sp.]